MVEGLLTASNTRNIFLATWKADWDDSHDVKLTYDRYIDRFLSLFTGTNITNERTRGVLGIRYILLMNFKSKLWIDTKGDVRVVLENNIQITARLSIEFEVEYDTDSEWEWISRAEWTLSKYLSLLSSYHSDYKGGIGLTIRF